MRHQKQRRTSGVAMAGTPHWPLPSRAHILMDATTMPYFLSASYSLTEALAHASRLLLHGRNYMRQWLWPLMECLFPVDDAAHRSCSDHSDSAAEVRVDDGSWCHCETTTELREARGLLWIHGKQGRQGGVGKKHQCVKMHSARSLEEKEDTGIQD